MARLTQAEEVRLRKAKLLLDLVESPVWDEVIEPFLQNNMQKFSDKLLNADATNIAVVAAYQSSVILYRDLLKRADYARKEYEELSSRT